MAEEAKAEKAKISTTATGVPVGTQPIEGPPEPGTYRYVLWRTDRTPRPTRVHVSYSKPPVIARKITFRGRVGEAVFVNTFNEMKMARRRHYRFDITNAWFTDLAVAAAKGPSKSDLMALGKAELVAKAEEAGLDASGTKSDIADRLLGD